MRSRALPTLALLAGTLVSTSAAAQSVATEPSGGAAKFQPSLIYYGDSFAVASGGLARGATYVGRLGIIIDSDLDALLGWKGATAHLSVHQIHGVGFTANNAGALMAVSSIEAEPATRLFNIWIEQAIGKSVSARIGQFTAGQEFFLSAVATPFVNATFGWPAIMAQNLPSGGPAYPLATPGARINVTASPRTTVLLAIFNGDPAGPGDGDPQRRDLAGFNAFQLSGAPFVIAEVQHGRTDNGCALCGPQLRVGGWVQFGKAANQFGAAAASEPATGQSAPAVIRRGDYGGYVIIDGGISTKGAATIAAFARIAAAPSDRNLVDLYGDAGITGTGLIPRRVDDVIGLAVGYSRLSRAARLAGGAAGIAGREVIIEATYRLQINRHFFVQPDVQLILNPSLQLTMPPGDKPLTPVENALVAGVRLNMKF